jgi:hypothetical protein
VVKIPEASAVLVLGESNFLLMCDCISEKKKFSHPPLGILFLALPGRVSGRERKEGRGGKRGWKALAMTVWSGRIHTSGVQRKWLLSSEDWEVFNVFSLPQIKCCSLELMVVFSSTYCNPNNFWRGEINNSALDRHSK